MKYAKSHFSSILLIVLALGIGQTLVCNTASCCNDAEFATSASPEAKVTFGFESAAGGEFESLALPSGKWSAAKVTRRFTPLINGPEKIHCEF